MASGHTGMGVQPTHGMREIDITTGKFKEVPPLKDALDYRKWDSIAVRASLCCAGISLCQRGGTLTSAHAFRARSHA